MKPGNWGVLDPYGVTLAVGLDPLQRRAIGTLHLSELGLVHHRDLSVAAPAVEELHRSVASERPNESRVSCGRGAGGRIARPLLLR